MQSIRNTAAIMAASMMAGFASLAGVGSSQTVDAPRSLQAANDATQGNNVTKNSPSRLAEANKLMAQMFGGGIGGSNHRRNPGPGWSNKHVQRLARKKRNVKANRKNHR